MNRTVRRESESKNGTIDNEYRHVKENHQTLQKGIKQKQNKTHTHKNKNKENYGAYDNQRNNDIII